MKTLATIGCIILAIIFIAVILIACAFIGALAMLACSEPYCADFDEEDYIQETTQ